LRFVETHTGATRIPNLKTRKAIEKLPGLNFSMKKSLLKTPLIVTPRIQDENYPQISLTRASKTHANAS
jgi:hypothetical protein